MQLVKRQKQTYPRVPETALQSAPSPEALELMSAELILELGAFVFEQTSTTVKVAALQPQNPALREFVKNRFGKEAEWFLITEQDLQRVINCCQRDFQKEIESLSAPAQGVNGNMVALADRIIAYALKEKASDVHLEPLRDETVVRFRLDGILRKVIALRKDLHQALVARFKILANLKIDEFRRPQDGRIEPKQYPNVSLRISIMPTLYGEKAALRILDESYKNLALEELGFSQSQQEQLLRNIEKPYGLIVTSGPTGSGKTTTLYGLLHLLKKDGINISTLEDPVEYALAGVNQIQINPLVELGFASGLRSLLRQDPDIIMVGEIRDSETAVMAVNAALTGHLVLTTLHTNDAPSAITRLLEMKVEDFAVGSTVNLVIAQRLVRKICPACAKEQPLDETVLHKIRERKDVVDVLTMAGQNIGKLGQMNFRAGTGCSVCLQSGYLGRVGIFEILELNQEIRKLILIHAPSERIKKTAAENGFADMLIDGISKVISGQTTFEEVLRTTRTS